MSSEAFSVGELEFNFVELILFGIHSRDCLFTADKYIHEATMKHHNHFIAQKKEKSWSVLHLRLTKSTPSALCIVSPLSTLTLTLTLI